MPPSQIAYSRRSVSIPIGFSNELQHPQPLPGPRSIRVSIPIGFSNELQPNLAVWGSSRRALFQSLSGFPMSCNLFGCHSVNGTHWFQSLSGFPMSCNSVSTGHPNPVESVSIPIGFSNELQPPHLGRGACVAPVSIPIGFSNELQPAPRDPGTGE